jgi:hypothetical protein
MQRHALKRLTSCTHKRAAQSPASCNQGTQHGLCWHAAGHVAAMMPSAQRQLMYSRIRNSVERLLTCALLDIAPSQSQRQNTYTRNTFKLSHPRDKRHLDP